MQLENASPVRKSSLKMINYRDHDVDDHDQFEVDHDGIDPDQQRVEESQCCRFCFSPSQTRAKLLISAGKIKIDMMMMMMMVMMAVMMVMMMMALIMMMMMIMVRMFYLSPLRQIQTLAESVASVMIKWNATIMTR